jgi:hypothetical protein
MGMKVSYQQRPRLDWYPYALATGVAICVALVIANLER